jgi:hypothetical protein
MFLVQYQMSTSRLSRLLRRINEHPHLVLAHSRQLHDAEISHEELRQHFAKQAGCGAQDSFAMFTFLKDSLEAEFLASASDEEPTQQRTNSVLSQNQKRVDVRCSGYDSSRQPLPARHLADVACNHSVKGAASQHMHMPSAAEKHVAFEGPQSREKVLPH